MCICDTLAWPHRISLYELGLSLVTILLAEILTDTHSCMSYTQCVSLAVSLACVLQVLLVASLTNGAVSVRTVSIVKYLQDDEDLRCSSLER